MDARRPNTGCRRHPIYWGCGSSKVGGGCLLQPMSQWQNSIIRCSGQAMARSSITGDNVPPHSQSGKEIPAKTHGLTDHCKTLEQQKHFLQIALLRFVVFSGQDERWFSGGCKEAVGSFKARETRVFKWSDGHKQGAASKLGKITGVLRRGASPTARLWVFGEEKSPSDLAWYTQLPSHMSPCKFVQWIL